MRYFAILRKGKPIGQIYLKHIHWESKSAEFGIALSDDSVKGKGYGTEAIALLAGHAFGALGIDTLLADSVLRNARSQHVLEKLGFQCTHEDSVFKYYRLEKERWPACSQNS